MTVLANAATLVLCVVHAVVVAATSSSNGRFIHSHRLPKHVC